MTQRFEDLRERCNQAGSSSSDAGTVRPIEDLEREAILNALKSTGNDKRLAAQLLGISRAKVYQRLKVWGLT
ncbi:MAG: helix-turn-helix domain-containing protein [Planctomycetota bacterium]